MKNPSVLNDLRPLIRKWLALRHETKSGARAILKSSLMSPPLEEWARSITLRGTNGSTELWKWRSVPARAEWNSSKEKVLEKAVAGKLPKAEWANQVVTAAGLSRNSGDCRRNIDLVHRTGAEKFRFIELKIGSNNPVYAAIELLEYALLLPNTRTASAAYVANRILQTLTVTPLIKNLDKKSLKLAFGVANLPADGDSVQQLLSAARKAKDRAVEANFPLIISKSFK